MDLKVRKKYVFSIVLVLLAFLFGVLNFSVTASAQTITDAESLNSALNKLKNNSFPVETTITIDGTEDIDFGDYEYAPFNLTSEAYDGKDYVVVFNVGVKNVIHWDTFERLDSQPHYGLFGSVSGGYVTIMYKVSFDVGEGTLNGGYSYYTFGAKAKDLPTVTAPEGSTFVKWVEASDAEETAVTQIKSSDWGVKKFVAVYESQMVEPDVPDPEEPEPEEPDPVPETYEIVYSDTVLGCPTDGLASIYTEGETLALGKLSKTGFTFNGWQVNGGAVIDEIPGDIPTEYVSEDGKIHLNATWSLKNPTINNVPNVIKTYDGKTSSLTAVVSHDLSSEVELSYSWYKANSEEEKESPTLFGNDSALSFKKPTKGYYNLKVSASHLESGLVSEVVTSNWAEVEIKKAQVEVLVLDAPQIEKPYDGNKDATSLVLLGTHYVAKGIVQGDGVKVELSSATFASENVGDNTVIANFSSLIFDSNDLADCYEFTPVSYELDGKITAKEVWLNKLSAPSISKEYDGLTKVNYEFVEGIDYSIGGTIGKLEHTITASYDNKNVGVGAVTLTVSFDSDNYFIIDNDVQFSAKITAKEVSVAKLSDVVISKHYDGTTNVLYDFIYGVDYKIEGVVDGELGVEGGLQYTTSKKYDDKNAGERVVTLSFSFSGNNYFVSNTEIAYLAKITPKEIVLQKGTEPSISKPYDGTTNVPYVFEYGVNYSISGVVSGELGVEGGLEYEVGCAFDSKNTGERKVILTVSFDNGNYLLDENTIQFDASITALELTPVFVSNPTITKDYDGTRDVPYDFELGVDFIIEGANGSEIKGIEVYAQYDKATVEATRVCVVFGQIEFAEGVESENYSYLSNYYEHYLTASISPYSVEIGAKNLSKIYGEPDSLTETIKTGVGEEEISVTYLRESGEEVGVYLYEGIVMNGTNANYVLNYVESESKFTILAKVPELVFPTFESADFNPNATLNDMVPASDEFIFENGKYITIQGEFYWLNSASVPFVENPHGYIMVFVPNDRSNYDYTGMEGYSPEGQTVIRTVDLTIFPIDPVPTDVEEEFKLAIGMLWSNVTLPEGWSIVHEEIDMGSFVNGEVGEKLNYANGLQYVHDETKNYNVIFKDFKVEPIIPIIAYEYDGEKVVSENQAIVNSSPNSEIGIAFVLENPFEKVGYKTAKWSVGEVEIIPNENGENTLGATYVLRDAQLIKNEIALKVFFEARKDITITHRHFYENLEGVFNEICDEERVYNNGEADANKTIESTDVINKIGFNYLGAKVGGEAYVTEFVVSASGDSVVSFYYARKSISISYVDEKYLPLNPIGQLPSATSVKYGVPFELSAPENYVIYGYTFTGYTDGLTYENGALKLFDSTYVVEGDYIGIRFSVNYRADSNVKYIIKRYFDGVLEEEICYGTTGTLIDVSNESHAKYVRVSDSREKLSGKISGYLLDEDDNVIGGSVLELSIYFETILYKVEIDGSLGIPEFEASEGETITLPQAPQGIPDGKKFAGWEVNGKLYMAGESFVMPAGSVSLVPKWESIEDVEQAPEEENTTPEEGFEGDDTTNDESVDEEEKGGLSVGGIVGIVIGSVAVLATILGVSISLAKKNKDREMLIQRMEARKRNTRKKK